MKLTKSPASTEILKPSAEVLISSHSTRGLNARRFQRADYTADEIPGWLSKNEGKLLAYFAKKADGPIVEIGSFQGKSTIYMAQATSQKIYAIDPHLGKVLSGQKSGKETYSTFLRNIKKFHVQDKVIPIRKTSAEANKNWRGKIALLHIDALHEYGPVKADLKMWLPHLGPNGVVVCHDAFAPYFEVWRAVKGEIFDKSGWAYIGVLDSQVFAIRGKPQLNWQRPFIVLASNIWHNKTLSEPFRLFLVNRVLKIFFLNGFMFQEILRRFW